MRIALISRLAAAVSAVVVLAMLTTITPASAALGPSVQLDLTGGATAHGLYQFTASGHVDPSQHDRPADIELLVDGYPAGYFDCAVSDTDPDPAVCTVSGQWDSTGANGAKNLQAQFHTDDDRLALSAPVTVTAVNPAPTVQIDSPMDTATVHGITSISVTAAFDLGQTDYLGSLQLLVDGQPFTGSGGVCTAAADDPGVCTATYMWDTTLATGSHTLQAELHTAEYHVVSTTAITVSVDNHGPAVHVVSPVSQALVKGVTQIDVTGTVDPAQNDQPGRFVLFQDGQPIAGSGVDCSAHDTDPDPYTCTVSIPWDTSLLSYGHTVSAEFFSVGNRSAASAPVQVRVFSTSITALVKHYMLSGDPHFTMHGSVQAKGSGWTVSSMRVRVVYRPASGKQQSVEVGTSSSGEFSAKFVSVGNGTVTATALGNSLFSGSVGTSKVTSVARITCTVAHATVVVGTADSGQCVVPLLPKGTNVVVQYHSSYHLWRPLKSGPSPAGGKINFVFRFSHVEGVAIRLVTAANPVFLKTTGDDIEVRVVPRPTG